MKTNKLKTAKKLKELGIKKESFCLWRFRGLWRFGDYSEDTAYIITQNCIDDCYLTTNDDILYPAYTLDEILEMLPKEIEDNFCDGSITKRYLLTVKSIFKKWEIYYLTNDGKYIRPIDSNENPAEAAAQLLIWCIENGYVKVEEINNEK